MCGKKLGIKYKEKKLELQEKELIVFVFAMFILT